MYLRSGSSRGTTNLIWFDSNLFGIWEEGIRKGKKGEREGKEHCLVLHWTLAMLLPMLCTSCKFGFIIGALRSGVKYIQPGIRPSQLQYQSVSAEYNKFSMRRSLIHTGCTYWHGCNTAVRQSETGNMDTTDSASIDEGQIYRWTLSTVRFAIRLTAFNYFVELRQIISCP